MLPFTALLIGIFLAGVQQGYPTQPETIDHTIDWMRNCPPHTVDEAERYREWLLEHDTSDAEAISLATEYLAGNAPFGGRCD